MKHSFKAVAVLTILCAIVAVVLGIANDLTAERIAANQELTRVKARTAVLPEGEYIFHEVSSSAFSSTSVTAAWEAKQNDNIVAYVFQMETHGYASGLVIMCGISADGRITGTMTVSSSETPALGGKTDREAYREQYIDKPEDGLSSIDGIAGATKTSEAYRNAVLDAFKGFHALTGGDDHE